MQTPKLMESSGFSLDAECAVVVLSSESTYKATQTFDEYHTGAYPLKRTANVAKRKAAAHHTRGSRSSHLEMPGIDSRLSLFQPCATVPALLA
jgi:hypothetical protein